MYYNTEYRKGQGAPNASGFISPPAEAGVFSLLRADKKAPVLVNELCCHETRRHCRFEVLLEAVRVESGLYTAAQRVDRKASVLRDRVIAVPHKIELWLFELDKIKAAERLQHRLVPRDHGDQHRLCHLRLQAEHVTESTVQIVVKGALREVVCKPDMFGSKVARITESPHCCKQ